MKKLFAVLLAVTMLLSLVACGEKENTNVSNNDISGLSQNAENNNSMNDGNNGDEGQDYENSGFTKKQRQIIAEQIGVTTEGEKAVFMYVVEEDDEVIYYDVYDQFNGTSCRYTDYRFCLNKDAYDGEYHDMIDSYDDFNADEKNLCLYGSEEAKFSWAGTWESLVDNYYNGLRAADYVIVE